MYVLVDFVVKRNYRLAVARIGTPISQNISELVNQNTHLSEHPVYGTTNAVYGTTNTDAGVRIGLFKGGPKNLIKKAIN